MFNRRDFLKNLFGLSLFFKFSSEKGSPLSLSSPEWGTDIDSSIFNSPTGCSTYLIGDDGQKYCWKETIFLLSDNTDLRAFLEELAPRIGSKIYYGDTFSLDILAVPSFVVVVDRNLMDRAHWDVYLSYCDETKDDTPCLIVDNLIDLVLPPNAYSHHFDLSDPSSFYEMKHLITEIKIQALYGPESKNHQQW